MNEAQRSPELPACNALLSDSNGKKTPLASRRHTEAHSVPNSIQVPALSLLRRLAPPWPTVSGVGRSTPQRGSGRDRNCQPLWPTPSFTLVCVGLLVIHDLASCFTLSNGKLLESWSFTGRLPECCVKKDSEATSGLRGE